jgi:hypothetical protein
MFHVWQPVTVASTAAVRTAVRVLFGIVPPSELFCSGILNVRPGAG